MINLILKINLIIKYIMSLIIVKENA